MENALTEQQIEFRVECMMNRIDHMFRVGDISEEEYDQRVMLLDKWASEQYEYSKKMGVM